MKFICGALALFLGFGVVLNLVPPAAQAQAVLVSGSTVLSGQASVTATAAALPNNAVRSVCLTVASGSSNTAFVGGSSVSTTTGFEIQKSSASVQPTVCLNVNNTAAVFAVSSGTATLDWIATTK